MVMIIGHRGGRNLWPENSLSGFRKLKAMPVEGVEFDVHLTTAGELLVIHDPTLEQHDTELRDRVAADVPWQAIVWDDPVNLMTYVTYVFRSYFGFPREKAERLMMQVHTEGRAVVASGNREQMEHHVQAMHGYGLQATVARAET